MNLKSCDPDMKSDLTFFVCITLRMSRAPSEFSGASAPFAG